MSRRDVIVAKSIHACRHEVCEQWRGLLPRCIWDAIYWCRHCGALGQQGDSNAPEDSDAGRIFWRMPLRRRGWTRKAPRR